MKKIRTFILMTAIILLWYCWSPYPDSLPVANALAGSLDSGAVTVPVKNMVTMVDLGADKCIPCKMMAPILKELAQEYRGKAAIVFLDVWKDPAPARKFRIRVIPTQIFFSEKGVEVARHEGFMSKNDIVSVLRKMGVK